MDWRRAKNILLVVLVLLNIFLFINVLNVKDPFDMTGQYQKDAKKALQAAGVIITGSIPSYTPVGRISNSQSDLAAYDEFVQRLTGLQANTADNTSENTWQNDRSTLSFLDGTFSYTLESGQQFPVESLNKLDRELKNWIRDNVNSKEVFVQDGLVQNGNTITAEYIRKYKNLRLFSQRISFTLIDGRLTKAEGSLKILHAIKVSKAANEIISPNIVLLTGKDEVQGIVISIDLGYLSLQGDDLYDTPVWRVTLASGEKVWFNAYTGEYIENGTSGL